MCVCVFLGIDTHSGFIDLPGSSIFDFFEKYPYFFPQRLNKFTFVSIVNTGSFCPYLPIPIGMR